MIKQISDAIGAEKIYQSAGADGAVRVVLKNGGTTIITPWRGSWQREEINIDVSDVVIKEILRLITSSHVEEDTLNMAVGITYRISKRCVEVVINLKQQSNVPLGNFGDEE